MNTRVGLIGLGLMGSAFAERMLEAKVQITGWDIEADKRNSLLKLGGKPARSANEVFESSEVVVLSLPNDRIVNEVLSSARDRFHDRAFIIDTTTGDPEGAIRHATWLGELGVHYIEATVSGSSQQLRMGQAMGMVSGKTDAIDPLRPLLERLLGQFIVTGSVGSASKAKLLSNLVLGLNRAALAEGLHFAKILGIDSDAALKLLRSTMAYSRIMDTKGDKMVREDFSVQAKLSQHYKDVQLMLDAASKNESYLPLSEAHFKMLKHAMDLGYGDSDNSALIKAWDRKTDEDKSQ